MTIDVGKTFKLTNDDIVIDNTRNIELVESDDKLRQDFDILLRTEKGGDIFHTSFGTSIRLMIDNPITEVIVRQVKQALALYRFVQSVGDVEVTFDYTNRIATVSASVTVGEEEVTVSLGVVL